MIDIIIITAVATSTSFITGASQTTEESIFVQWDTKASICILIGTFRPDVAYKVMTECTGMIKEDITLNPLVDKLVEKRIINESEKNHILDDQCGLTADQRMDKLLGFVKASINRDGEDFRLFIEIIKQENTRRADRLVQKLLDTYNKLNVPS